jgi:hypothetical protein
MVLLRIYLVYLTHLEFEFDSLVDKAACPSGRGDGIGGWVTSLRT